MPTHNLNVKDNLRINVKYLEENFNKAQKNPFLCSREEDGRCS